MKKLKIQKNIFLVAVVFILSFLSMNSTYADSCTLTKNDAAHAFRQGRITISIVKVNSSLARLTITNNTECSFSGTANSFRVYNNISFDSQKLLYQASTKTVPAYSSQTFDVKLDSCLTQVDGYYAGPGEVAFLRGLIFGPDGSIFNNIPSAYGTFCTDTPKPQDLQASCTASPSAVNVGGSVSWGVSASGGNGSYSYSWSGSDSLVGNSAFVSRSYNTAGSKTGTVTVTSGNQTITKTCNAVVNENQTNNLSVSCNASPSRVEVDEEVEWQASVSGGNGSYSYSWSGSEGLSGSQRNIDWEYNNDGTKTGTVTVTSNGQSASASCTVRVDEEEDDDDVLEVSCYANPTNPQIGSRMNWYARVDGGDGDYDYEWTGTDGLDSSSRSPSMTYYTAGTKRATVEVRDGNGQRETRTCNAYVNQNIVLAFSETNQPPLAQAVYLNQVPYTGIADDYKSAIFMTVLALLSAWVAYAVISYKKNNPEQI